MSDYRNGDYRDRDRYGWGIPAIIIAAILIIGGFWYVNSGTHVTTEANNATRTRQAGPVVPGNPVPEPATVAPAPNR
jgi:hypothetical protein